MKSLLETLTAGAGYLEKNGVDEARLNMEHLLAHVLGCRRLDLYLRHGETLHEDDLARLGPHPRLELLERASFLPPRAFQQALRGETATPLAVSLVRVR